SSRRRHTRFSRDWSSDVCSSDLCVITVITRGKDEILLAKNAHNTKSQMYGLIAGFVEVGETLEDAVRRETLEEVGLQLKNIQYQIGRASCRERVERSVDGGAAGE